MAHAKFGYFFIWHNEGPLGDILGGRMRYLAISPKGVYCKLRVPLANDVGLPLNENSHSEVVMPQKVFLSYCGSSPSIAIQLNKQLENHGFYTFIALKQHLTNWLDYTSRQILDSDVFVLCLTHDSLSAKYQKDEYTYAHDCKKRIVIVHDGPWDPRWAHPDHFPMCGTFPDRFQFGKHDLQRLLKSLELPESQRLRFMQNLGIEVAAQLMHRYGIRFQVGRPLAVDGDNRKNYATKIDQDLQRVISDRISERYPGEYILAEEPFTSQERIHRLVMRGQLIRSMAP